MFLTHSKGVFIKERSKINKIWGFAGHINSFHGPYVVHAWSSYTCFRMSRFVLRCVLIDVTHIFFHTQTEFIPCSEITKWYLVDCLLCIITFEYDLSDSISTSSVLHFFPELRIGLQRHCSPSPSCSTSFREPG